MRKHVIDLADPSGKGEQVEIQLPGGTVTVSAGLVKPATGQSVVHVQINDAQGWKTTVHPNPVMGSTDIRQTQE